MTFSVDVTECPISKPRDFEVQRLLWSRKKERCTLKYEIATHIATGEIIWLAGGVPKRHDKKILEDFGLMKRLEPWEKGIADKGYQGASNRIMTPYKRRKHDRLTKYELYWNRCISSVRATAERTNGWLKIFRVLHCEWRGEIALHYEVFLLLAQMTNIRMKFHPIVKKYNPLLHMNVAYRSLSKAPSTHLE